MMFIDKNDGLRDKLEIGQKDANAAIRRSHPDFGVSMPAFGEAICKIIERNTDSGPVFAEMTRLIDISFMTPKYISKPSATYGLARTICSDKADGRDSISPMDGLILATAAVDTDCRVFYTRDSRLQVHSDAWDAIDEYRADHDADPLAIRPIDDLFA